VPIPLETARLRLRHFTAADAADLADLHGDPEVMRFIDDGRPVPRATVERDTLPAILREYATLSADLPSGPASSLPAGFGRLAAEDRGTGEFLGWFALRPATSVGLTGGTELGYRLRRAAWGRGYATEGARALVRAAFQDLAVDRVVATTMTVNTASRRVLEKAGLTLVRTFFADWPDPIPGADQGDVEYALTRTAWLTR
jgi:RimJ/RimL family protein N-acetyltransferase